MPVTRLELHIEGLPITEREALLDVVWNELKISPGMVTADGTTELTLVQGETRPEDRPLVHLGGVAYPQMTPERLGALLRRRGTR
ncbi:hypothetical protein MF271_13850 [Deinococcus sp. KNUC1210]|uniref:hypothetical protein n=1 Tax=Deinococcus sp. KNUC1210 TaxID=2917691 RepID=UPI001EEFF6D7|nr:hypothetical protein [Deinococcus sp. KNUC1210]ULH15032.1 hypothetical protein MF271_13850 [Deinococcus sp. KNUC1210]